MKTDTPTTAPTHNTSEQDLEAMDAATLGSFPAPPDIQSGLKAIHDAATTLLPSASAEDALVVAGIANSAARLLESLKAGERRYLVG